MQLDQLALKYARLQHAAVHHAQEDPNMLRQHITQTLQRCLPSCIVNDMLIDECLHVVRDCSVLHDPMHTGVIHAFAGEYLQDTVNPDNPLLERLHASALRLLPKNRPASRADLRLVTLDAFYQPGVLPQGRHTAYLRHRLGLGVPRLSNEEIAVRMRRPIVYIHELESAILTILTSNYSGGPNA